MLMSFGRLRIYQQTTILHTRVFSVLIVFILVASGLGIDSERKYGREV
jgi:hypothetical protein